MFRLADLGVVSIVSNVGHQAGRLSQAVATAKPRELRAYLAQLEQFILEKAGIVFGRATAVTRALRVVSAA